MNKLRLISFIVATTAMFSSCTKVDLTLGEDLLANTDKLEIGSTTFESFKAFTTTIDSIPTSIWSSTIIGSLVTPAWGQTNYSFITSLIPYSGYDYDSIMGIDPIIDSVKLSIYPSSTTGDTTVQLGVSVYELNRVIPDITDSLFYSNFDYSSYVDGESLASIVVGNTGRFEVDLPIEYGNIYLDTVGGHYLDDSLFVTKFPGLLFKTNNAFSGGAARKINLASSGVEIYYHNFNEEPDTTVLFLAMMKSTSSIYPYFTMIDNNFNLADPVVGLDQDIINDSVTVQTSSYIKAQAGLMTVLEFDKSEFDELKATVTDAGYSKIAISSAVVTIPIKDATPTTMSEAVAQLGVYNYYQNLDFSRDFSFQVEYQNSSTDGSYVTTYYNGYVDRVKKAYVVNLSSTIQSILSDEDDDEDIYRYEIASNYLFDSVYAGVTLDVENIKMDLTYVMVK